MNPFIVVKPSKSMLMKEGSLFMQKHNKGDYMIKFQEVTESAGMSTLPKIHSERIKCEGKKPQVFIVDTGCSTPKLT